jgi:hypothetical protein
MSPRTSTLRTTTMHKLTLLCLIFPFALAAAPAPAFAPLAFLAGHCWKGTFPDGAATDEHCFSWIYDGAFLRDEHVVRGAQGEMRGESIYYRNAAVGQIEYLYIESAGGYSHGSMTTQGAELLFPETALVGDGVPQLYRGRWKPLGAEAYDVVVEFKSGEQWAPGFAMRMQRSR